MSNAIEFYTLSRELFLQCDFFNPLPVIMHSLKYEYDYY